MSRDNWANRASLPLDMCAPDPTADQRRKAGKRGVYAGAGNARLVNSKVWDPWPLLSVLCPDVLVFLKVHPHHLLP
jgi:hypothetical protein